MAKGNQSNSSSLKEQFKTFEMDFLHAIIRALDAKYFYIIGGYARYLKGEAKSFNDVDVIIPIGNNQWLADEIDDVFVVGITKNKFGGIRIHNIEGVSYDMWTLDSMGLSSDASIEEIREAMPLKEGQKFSILKFRNPIW